MDINSLGPLTPSTGHATIKAKTKKIAVYGIPIDFCEYLTIGDYVTTDNGDIYDVLRVDHQYVWVTRR